ncbi:MAG: dihydrofolate reductase [Eubacterium sp.]|nr:dihydrofolate reductase [Eubacterium sp.]
MSLSLIAAIGKNNELGRGNDLIWHFREDMQFFKATTTGHTVIMGRKTFESLPKALPNRRNIVITADSAYCAAGAETADSVEAALALAGEGEAFVIGGGRVYRELLPLCDKLYLTEIDAACADADTFFPAFDRSLYHREQLSDFTVDGVHFAHYLYRKNK